MKGAFVEFTQSFLGSTPNLVVFQFNPETLRHSWTQATAATAGGNPLAVQGMPGEAFSFSLSMDATDQLAEGPQTAAGADAGLNGIYTRLSALEMLLFPVDTPATGGGARAVPSLQLPTVLFVWGKGRVLPVRVTSLTITEKLFDAQLNPTHADAAIELKVLTPAELEAVTGPLKELARAAYLYTKSKRELLAVANLFNAASAIELPPLVGL